MNLPSAARTFYILDQSSSTPRSCTLEDVKRVKAAFAVSSYSELNVGGLDFERVVFLKLLALIKKADCLKTVILTFSLLSTEQFHLLEELVSCNHKKGLRILDSKNKKLPYPFDPRGYIEAKSKRICYVEEMRETTRRALEEYQASFDRFPEGVVDFGAGTGDCAIPLILLGCPKVTAIDGDEPSLKILMSRLNAELAPDLHPRGLIEMITSPFIKVPLVNIDMLISSFTLPYRRPVEFPFVWDKVADCLKPKGIFAGHLFSCPSKPKEGMTYHTLEEAASLLNRDFEIIWINEQTTGFKIFNGDGQWAVTTDDDPSKREWGTLIHFVARKKNSSLAS